VTESCAALRVGEACGTPVALHSGGTMRVRGRPFPWHEERGDGPGIRSVRLQDDPSRVAMLAESA
jgi:hypothetical protein